MPKFNHVIAATISLLVSAFFIIPTWAHSQNFVLIIGIVFAGISVAIAANLGPGPTHLVFTKSLENG
jgi:hypothetical protein